MGFAPGGVWIEFKLSRLYGLWYAFPCKPTWWTKKGMECQGVWVSMYQGYGLRGSRLYPLGAQFRQPGSWKVE